MTAWGKYDEHTINAGEDQRKAYYDQLLKRYAMSLYKWDGLNTFLMERILYESGKAVVFRSKFLPDLSIGTISDEQLNAEGEIKAVRPVLPYTLGTEDMLEVGKDAVVIYDTESRFKRSALLYGTDIMGEIDEAIRVQTDNQKFPLIAITDDGAVSGKSNMESIKFFVKAIYQNAKCLFVPSSVASSLQTMDLNKDYNAQPLLQTKRSILNDNLTQLGIDSQDAFPKAERKIVSEQEGNNDELWIARQDCLRARQAGADQIKAVFGVDVSVKCTLDDVPAPVSGNDGGDNNGQGNTD